MKSGGINSWLQIASNLGLIGGLVLVAVQIQQHRDPPPPGAAHARAAPSAHQR